MDESVFHETADIILEDLVDGIEMADEEGEVEVDYIDGVVSIILPDGSEYIINKHEPSRQIWLSSPFSGSNKFSYNEDEDDWMPEEGRNFKDFISIEFSTHCNINLDY